MMAVLGLPVDLPEPLARSLAFASPQRKRARRFPDGPLILLLFLGSDARTRTADPVINSHLLYQLS